MSTGKTPTKIKKVFRYDYVEVLRVIDGDTVELKIDMGNNTFWTDKFRLKGIDAPEMHGETAVAGIISKGYLERFLAEGIRYVKTHKEDKFGRCLVEIYDEGLGVCVNEQMLIAGHATPYDGGKRRD